MLSAIERRTLSGGIFEYFRRRAFAYWKYPAAIQSNPSLGLARAAELICQYRTNRSRRTSHPNLSFKE